MLFIPYYYQLLWLQEDYENFESYIDSTTLLFLQVCIIAYELEYNEML